jgi:sigma-B regulation protein RsbU (phosphoserine phosphatase)
MSERFKILIVDDEPFNVDYLEQEMEDLGHDTVSAFNGQEALEQVAAEAPDLILLDIMMPVMNGFEVLSRLKAGTTWRNLPVVIISAISDMDSIAKGIEMGADDYLPKPFDPILLNARLSSCLEKKRLRDQEQLYLQSLERELEIGRQIQAGFLPDELPQHPNWNIAAYLQPAREVAGDFYDSFYLAKEERIGLILGDVCDKGVGAALYMALFRSLLRAISNPGGFAGWGEECASGEEAREDISATAATKLRNTVDLTNCYIANTHGQSNMFATVFFGMLDPITGSLIYVNAGHEPPIVFNEAGIKTHLQPTGPVVGLFPGMEFIVEETLLEPGDTLLVFSDGVPDTENAEGEFFGEGALLSLLAESHETPADLLLELIATRLQKHRGDAKQLDDITMLAVQRAQRDV